MRSAVGRGGCVEGFLLGDGGVFFLGRGGPGGGVVGVTVDGELLEAGHVAETIQWDRFAVAVARLELREMGNGVVVRLLLGLGFRLGARRGTGALGRSGLSGCAAVPVERLDTGVEGAVLGDGGPGVPVGLDAGQAWRGGEGAGR